MFSVGDFSTSASYQGSSLSLSAPCHSVSLVFHPLGSDTKPPYTLTCTKLCFLCCFSRQLHWFIFTLTGLYWSHMEATNWDKVFTPKCCR